MLTFEAKGVRVVVPQKAIDRFWGMVNRRSESECWTFTGKTNHNGYGLFCAGSHSIRAHRFSYLIAFGEFDNSLLVCHHCDNPLCVNPSHLFLGTHKDNAMDCCQKNRKGRSVVLGERNGKSKLDAEKVIAIRRQRNNGDSFLTISKRFGCHKGTIQAICYRVTWKHI